MCIVAGEKKRGPEGPRLWTFARKGTASAAHGRGTDELLKVVLPLLPPDEEGAVETAAFMLHTSATPYFIKYVAGRADLVGGFMMVFYVGLAVGSGACSTLTRFATRQVWIAVMLGVAALVGLALYLCPGHALIVLFVLQGLSGAAFGVVSTLSFAMYADAADYNAWKTGYRATAMTYSMINVGKKIAAAAAGAALGWLLSRHGYVAGDAPQAALSQMRAALGLFPAALCVLGIAVILIYDLTPAKDDYVLAKPGQVYAVYLPDGGSTTLDLSQAAGSFEVKWYNPRTGGALQDGSVRTVEGGGSRSLGKAPSDTTSDWAVLVRKVN